MEGGGEHVRGKKKTRRGGEKTMKAERGEAQEAMCARRSKILENSWTVLVTKLP